MMRRESDFALAGLPLKLSRMESRVSALEAGLVSNTALTQRVFDNTKTLVEGVQAATSFWAFTTKWAKRFAVFMKYVGYVAAAGAAVYAFAEHIAQFDIVNWRRK